VSSAENVIEKLSGLLGAEHVIADVSRMEHYGGDALSEGRIHPLRKPNSSNPLCIVYPASTEDVREIVLLANAEKISIVPYGGGSGLMGGAISLLAGIVLDLKRMQRVLEIDAEAETVRVGAGIVLESLADRLEKKKLMLGHDPWTLPVATVGGAISTNSLGYRGGKYGSMGDQVLGLEVVLPSGEILRTRPIPKSSTGIDLKRLFIGGEGCFGVATEATLRVFPLPAKRSLRVYNFPSFEAGFSAVQEIFSAALRPVLLDFGDDSEKTRGGADLYLGFEGVKEMVELEERLAGNICENGGARSLPQKEAERFWDERHVIAHLFMHNRQRRRWRRGDPFIRDWLHVALPASRVLPYRAKAMEIIARRGLHLQESGLWTRPELFSLRMATGDGSSDPLVLQETIDDLIAQVQEMGGSMEYCHGVGLKLAPFMAAEHGYGLEVMRQIKKALDPNDIMNPGKMGL
jgi:alkyldihydroxyacetonephosphate synthase